MGILKDSREIANKINSLKFEDTEFISYEDTFLKTKTLKIIRECKDEFNDDWNYLNKDEKIIILTIIFKIHNNIDNAIIFLESILTTKNIDSNLSFDNIINIIINNYNKLIKVNILDIDFNID